VHAADGHEHCNVANKKQKPAANARKLQVVSDCLRVLLEVLNAALIAPVASGGAAAPAYGPTQQLHRSSSGSGNVALLAQQQLLKNLELLYALLHGQVGGLGRGGGFPVQSEHEGALAHGKQLLDARALSSPPARSMARVQRSPP